MDIQVANYIVTMVAVSGLVGALILEKIFNRKEKLELLKALKAKDSYEMNMLLPETKEVKQPQEDRYVSIEDLTSKDLNNNLD